MLKAQSNGQLYSSTLVHWPLIDGLLHLV